MSVSGLFPLNLLATPAPVAHHNKIYNDAPFSHWHALQILVCSHSGPSATFHSDVLRSLPTRAAHVLRPVKVPTYRPTPCGRLVAIEPDLPHHGRTTSVSFPPWCVHENNLFPMDVLQDTATFHHSITTAVAGLRGELQHCLSPELCRFILETLDLDNRKRPSLSALVRHEWMAKHGFGVPNDDGFLRPANEERRLSGAAVTRTMCTNC